MDYVELWSIFEKSGSVADYLAYKTGTNEGFQEGELGNADNNRRNCHS